MKLHPTLCLTYYLLLLREGHGSLIRVPFTGFHCGHQYVPSTSPQKQVTEFHSHRRRALRAVENESEFFSRVGGNKRLSRVHVVVCHSRRPAFSTFCVWNVESGYTFQCAAVFFVDWCDHHVFRPAFRYLFFLNWILRSLNLLSQHFRNTFLMESILLDSIFFFSSSPIFHAVIARLKDTYNNHLQCFVALVSLYWLC